jgi:2'-5' RNA ligase
MRQKIQPAEITASLSSARVFFALWPGLDMRQELHAVAEEYALPCAARVMRAEGLHLTLLYIGEIERTRLTALRQAASTVSAAAFWLEISQLKFWQHNKIGYATVEHAALPLARLVVALTHAVQAAGFPLVASEFHAHITMLRKVQHGFAPQTISPLCWWVDSFALIESVGTGEDLRYEILALWPLVGIKVGPSQ